MSTGKSRRSVSAVFLAGIGVTAILGLGAGTAASAVASLLSPAGLSPVPGGSAQPVPDPVYETNMRGQTVGSAANATSPYGEPDLILAIATNGREGYVLKADLDSVNGQTASESFESPEDALKWQETQGRADYLIPVYEADGVTKIGEFRVYGGESQERSAELIDK